MTGIGGFSSVGSFLWETGSSIAIYSIKNAIGGAVTAVAVIAIEQSIIYIYKHCQRFQREDRLHEDRLIVQGDNVSGDYMKNQVKNLVSDLKRALRNNPQYLQDSIKERKHKIVSSIAIRIAVIFPVFEEIAFRGILQNFLKSFLPTYASIIITSLAFGGFHNRRIFSSKGLAVFIPPALGGLAYGTANETFGLLAPIFAHMFHNGKQIYLNQERFVSVVYSEMNNNVETLPTIQELSEEKTS